MATVLEQNDPSLLTSDKEIGRGNALFHSDWDNFEALLTGIHNKPSVHTAAGIMPQETTGEHEVAKGSSTMSLPRTRERYLHNAPVSLPPFSVSIKRRPYMDIQQVQQYEGNVRTRCNATEAHLVWILCRFIGGQVKQSVPGFGGFVSATELKPSSKTTISTTQTSMNQSQNTRS